MISLFQVGMTCLFSCDSVKAWELQRIFEDRGPSLHLARIASTKQFFRGVRSSLIIAIPEPGACLSSVRLPSS
jgi:hypothetical protein